MLPSECTLFLRGPGIVNLCILQKTLKIIPSNRITSYNVCYTKLLRTVDQIVPHLDISVIRHGDVGVGTLPIHLAAEIQRLGGRYIHLSFEVPFELRGVELTSDQLNAIGANLQEFSIEKKV